MADLKNTFSWSHSRSQLFDLCRRKYYLNHYAFWGGWSAQAPADVREIYIQKKLTTLPQWIGSMVHQAAEQALKALMYGQPAELQALSAALLLQARAEIDNSLKGAYRRMPSRITAFQEHYYQQPLPADAWTEALQQIEQQVANLFQEPVYRRLCQVPQKLREVENLEQVDISGIPVWVRLDALIEDGNGGWVVVDWKTGRQHDEDVIQSQLGVYGLYCVTRHGADPDRITTMYVNLRSQTRQQYSLPPAFAEETRARVLASANTMLATLVDPRENIARAEDFPPLPEGSGACRQCVFRATCGRT